MTELLWLKRVWVDTIHFQQLQRFGGLCGVRDAGAIRLAPAQFPNLPSAQAVGALIDGERMRMLHLERVLVA